MQFLLLHTSGSNVCSKFNRIIRHVSPLLTVSIHNHYITMLLYIASLGGWFEVTFLLNMHTSYLVSSLVKTVIPTEAHVFVTVIYWCCLVVLLVTVTKDPNSYIAHKTHTLSHKLIQLYTKSTHKFTIAWFLDKKKISKKCDTTFVMRHLVFEIVVTVIWGNSSR